MFMKKIREYKSKNEGKKELPQRVLYCEKYLSKILTPKHPPDESAGDFFSKNRNQRKVRKRTWQDVGQRLRLSEITASAHPQFKSMKYFSQNDLCLPVVSVCVCASKK
jgi:hypothetical protein